MQEVLTALIDEMSAKPAPPRSSKRARAAEVHNLSEKVVPPQPTFLNVDALSYINNLFFL